MSEIRVSVLGIIRRENEYLVQRLVDPSDGPFYRPIGGGVEFGEATDAALEREFQEELDVTISAGPTVGTLENRFTWKGTPCHELLILREAEFEDESLYEREAFHGIDAGGTVEYDATWKSLEELANAPEPLYPDGLDQLLRGDGGAGKGHVDGT